jgi:hypothetical protein
MTTRNIQTIQTDFVPHLPAKENKEKEKGITEIASGEMEKENAGIKTKGTGPTIKDKPIHKTPIKPKEKGMAKVSKGKAK